MERAGVEVHIRRTLRRSKVGLVISEPKTAGSRWQIGLGDLPVDALRRQRVRQNAERLVKGPTWQDNGLVFANDVGNPIEDTNLRRRSFEPLLAKPELPRIRFNDTALGSDLAARPGDSPEDRFRALGPEPRGHHPRSL